MQMSFYLTGDVKSVSKVFSEIVDVVEGASGWTLNWPGAGATERDAVVQVGVTLDTALVEKAARDISKAHGVVFRPATI